MTNSNYGGGDGGDGQVVITYTSSSSGTGCKDVFPSGLQNTTDSGKITFGWNGQVFNDPDSKLETVNPIDFNVYGKPTCGTTDCGITGTPSTPATVQTFKTTSTNHDHTVNAGATFVLGSDGTDSYRNLTTGNGSLIQDNGAYTTYYINTLQLGYQSHLILEGGSDYWINTLSLNTEVQISVAGSGTARLFVNQDMTIAWADALNAAGSADKLLIVANSNVSQQAGSTPSHYLLYSLGNVSLGDSTRLTGAVAAQGDIATANSDAQIFYDADAVADVDSRGVCTGSGNQGPAAEFRFDESAWNGTNGEVVDSSGNGFDGTAEGGATTGDGKVCNGGVFNGSTGYVDVPGLSSILNGTASLAFWIKTTQTGDDTDWKAPAIAGMEQNGGTDDIFWGWIDASGHIGISTGNDGNAKSIEPINDGDWHHIVLTRNADDGRYQIYIDGNLAPGDTGTTEHPNLTLSYSSIGRVENTNSSIALQYFSGTLDEVNIFPYIISAAQVNKLMNTTRPCAVSGVDHFVITHNGHGINCLPEPVTVTAVDADGATVTDYAGTITLDTGSGKGSWELKSGGGSFSDPTANDGLASYTFDPGDGGVAQFELSYSEGNSPITIRVSDFANNATGTADPLAFSPSGFTVTSTPLGNPPANPLPFFPTRLPAPPSPPT